MMAIPEAMSDDMREQFKRNQDRLEKLYEARSEQFRIAAERVHQAQKHNQMKNLLGGGEKKDKYIQLNPDDEKKADNAEKKEKDSGKKENKTEKKEEEKKEVKEENKTEKKDNTDNQINTAESNEPVDKNESDIGVVKSEERKKINLFFLCKDSTIRGIVVCIFLLTHKTIEILMLFFLDKVFFVFFFAFSTFWDCHQRVLDADHI
ncbi:hypothetical protein RFI_32897 [Reticulomyxa filosa]|uniref:Uncharacterized protein n=1 Tax=Reticulomyxa filosa TaxID=46433 RepID=X6LRK0_RETFI|nr:hypothetical protein RFI_32897 [Reticulomyxa filosa]|eukprot:ETO04498.1 hypothetical protein RFI_32897 [Reticulomyxa filosa]